MPVLFACVSVCVCASSDYLEDLKFCSPGQIYN